MANKFWMVWRAQGNSPTRMHGSEIEACNEARRLAESNPNCDFYVLEAKVQYRGDITVSSHTCNQSNDEADK